MCAGLLAPSVVSSLCVSLCRSQRPTLFESTPLVITRAQPFFESTPLATVRRSRGREIIRGVLLEYKEDIQYVRVLMQCVPYFIQFQNHTVSTREDSQQSDATQSYLESYLYFWLCICLASKTVCQTWPSGQPLAL